MAVELYIIDGRRWWNGQPGTAFDRHKPLPPGAFLTDQVPPAIVDDEVAVAQSDGGWRVRKRLPLIDPPQPVPKSRFTQAEFYNLFTDEEIGKWQIALAKAKSADNPTPVQILLVAMEARFMALEVVDLTNPKTRDGLVLLTHPELDVLEQDRPDELLDGIPAALSPPAIIEEQTE